MDFDYVLFDLDGTLLDTSKGILNSVKDTIRHFELPMLDENQLKVFMGCSIYDAFSRFFPDSESSQLVSFFRKMYTEKHFEEASEYYNIEMVFEKLHRKGVKIGVATFKREDLALKLLSKYSFFQYIDSISGSDAEGKLQKPDIIKNCLRLLNTNSLNNVVVIGDAENDYKAAKDLGVNFIGVTYGYGFAESDESDFPTAKTPMEIIDYLRTS